MTYRENVAEAGHAVNEAIDLLNRVPMNYGGHVEKEGTSTIDTLLRDDSLWQRAMRVCQYPIA